VHQPGLDHLQRVVQRHVPAHGDLRREDRHVRAVRRNLEPLVGFQGPVEEKVALEHRGVDPLGDHSRPRHVRLLTLARADERLASERDGLGVQRAGREAGRSPNVHRRRLLVRLNRDRRIFDERSAQRRQRLCSERSGDEVRERRLPIQCDGRRVSGREDGDERRSRSVLAIPGRFGHASEDEPRIGDLVVTDHDIDVAGTHGFDDREDVGRELGLRVDSGESLSHRLGVLRPRGKQGDDSPVASGRRPLVRHESLSPF
jgi:hypothetical protein